MDANSPKDNADKLNNDKLDNDKLLKNVADRDELIKKLQSDLEVFKIEKEAKKPIFILNKKRYEINAPSFRILCKNPDFFNKNQLGKSIIFQADDIKENKKLQEYLLSISSKIISLIPKT